MTIAQDKAYITIPEYLTEVDDVQLNTILGATTGSLDNLELELSYKQSI